MTLSTRSRATDEDQLDRVFHAMADRTRRGMLGCLAKGPASIGTLATPYAMSLTAVSKHLRVLEGAGLVRRDIEGRVHRCSFDARPLRDLDQWLAHYRTFWEGSLESLARHVEGGHAQKKR